MQPGGMLTLPEAIEADWIDHPVCMPVVVGLLAHVARQACTGRWAAGMKGTCTALSAAHNSIVKPTCQHQSAALPQHWPIRLLGAVLSSCLQQPSWGPG